MSDGLSHLRAECDDCDRVEIEEPEHYDRLYTEMADHIDDGTPCHGYSFTEVYEDGSERHV